VKRALLLLVGAALLAAVLYALYLDHLVVHQFEGRRWTLPAQVYAAPLELYAGLPLTVPAVEHELQRLHYRRTDRSDQPGTYRLAGERLEVWRWVPGPEPPASGAAYVVRSPEA